MIDIHSHILPGMDDGPTDDNLSLEMFRIAEEEGIKEIIATPHYIPGVYNNNYDKVKENVDKINEVLKREGIKVKVHIGAEHYIDDTLQHLIKDKSLSTINNQGKYILVEFPMQEIPAYGEEILFEIQLMGITPILAHPERNAGIIKKPAYLYDLISKGTLMQINASSLLGHFGSTVAEGAHSLLKNNWVHFIASDAHSTGVRSPRINEALKIAKKLIGDKAYELVYDNPGKVLRGEMIEIGEVKEYKRTKNDSFFSKFKKFF